MIIAIDGYEANELNRVGVGRYAFEILKHMFEYFKTHDVGRKTQDKTRFRIYLPEPPLPDMPAETPWWHYRIVQPKKLWTLFRLPLALSSDQPRADVIFSPTHYIPRFTSIPRVMAIMDLSYLVYTELFRRKDIHQLIHWTRYSAFHAKKILTISKFSRDAIIREYARSPEDVVVTYPGLSMKQEAGSKKPFVVPVSTGTPQGKQEAEVRKKYGLNNNYILSVGTLQPRKNYVRLIEAFSMLKRKNPDLSLAIVGKKGWLYEEILEAPRTFHVAESVRFLDFVAGEDLPDLYRHAVCFALPSLYEGFGLPVLEAMAEGTIVVTSNVSSLPEVAGSAGIYVDPMNIESIKKGLEQAVTEKGTDEGDLRAAAGRKQAKQFSWEKAAQETLRVLEEVAGK
ncbi:MAG: glycosyltransferase family 1 protein [bacterium]|nr:glycosyltransferase family 1 protein [bacterium]